MLLFQHNRLLFQRRVGAFLSATAIVVSLSGCGTGFGVALGAGFLGTVFGNMASDTIEGKWYPGKPAEFPK